MSSPFLSGLLSLVEADTEVALIPAAQTFLDSWLTAKTSVQRAAAVAQLEGNLLVSAAGVIPTFISQELPVVNAALQSVLAKAQATVTAATPA
jgi:hypothetical protein